MLKVPFYTQQNYRTIIGKEYVHAQTTDWIDIFAFVALWTDDFIKTYAGWDAIKLTNYLSDSSLKGDMILDGKTYSRKDILIASKLLMPTPWMSDYFFWNVGSGTHTGIDIMLPKGTPIPSFSAGKVVRVKVWDGVKQDEGNCVVIKSPAGFWYGYKHLDTIAVKDGQEITRGQTIGTCGTTGRSTQYHLHLQVDSKTAPFYPYWSSVSSSVKRYTHNPLHVLQSQLSHSSNAVATVSSVVAHDVFVDMPGDTAAQQAFRALYKADIVKGYNSKVYPDDHITRQQASLLMHRIAFRYNIYQKLAIKNPMYLPYTDVTSQDPEFHKALKNMQYYGIMVGRNNLFQPFKTILGEEWIALLARMCYGLQDSPSGNRYDSYVLYFQTKKIIPSSWSYIGKPIVRRDAFILLYRVLCDKGYISE